MGVKGMIQEQHGDLVFYRWRIFEEWTDRLTACLTGRQGGYSIGHLAGLNMGHAVNDESSHLAGNRNAVADALNLKGYSWSVANQVHGTRCASVTGDDVIPHPGTDALELSHPGIIAAVMLADCHPIILFDPVRRVVTACHAGWRGTAAGMAEVSVGRMLEGGSVIGDIRAATGPGIGACCYQVGMDVKTAFESASADPENVLTGDGPGKWRLDIEQENYNRLRNLGLKEDRIGRGGFCTACRPNDFYSYRKEKGLTGRQAALVALLPSTDR